MDCAAAVSQANVSEGEGAAYLGAVCGPVLATYSRVERLKLLERRIGLAGSHRECISADSIISSTGIVPASLCPLFALCTVGRNMGLAVAAGTCRPRTWIYHALQFLHVPMSRGTAPRRACRSSLPVGNDRQAPYHSRVHATIAEWRSRPVPSR